MGQLIDGEWRSTPLPVDSAGEFVRAASTFRHWIGSPDQPDFPAVPGRYHLYVARACPWCHRTMIARVAKRLENIVSISFVEPFVFDNGWAFAKQDPLTGVRYIHELYSQADPLFTGRATVPVLWDKENNTIVNNESSEIIRFFNSEFNDFLPPDRAALDFYPENLRPEIDDVNTWMYETINSARLASFSALAY